MEWVSVKDRLPENADNGVHDPFPVLVMTSEPYGHESEWDIRITTWMNNKFQTYPQGATDVTHWMPLPCPPEK